MNPLFIFYIVTGLIMLAASIAMVATSNMVYSVLYMVIVFLGTAVLYILYQAPLIAMVQIAVYAGGIMVLFLFVVMLIGPGKMPHAETLRWQRPLAFILAAALSIELIYLALHRYSQYLLLRPAGAGGDFGSPITVGLMIFNHYTLAFEVVSVLLLVAMVGAIVLTARKGRE